MRSISLLAAALAVSFVSAHPGHDPAEEAAELRERMALLTRTDLSHCAEKIKERGLEARAVKRRNEHAHRLLKKRNLESRDLADLLKLHHHSNQPYTLDTPLETIFATNNSCVLSPEVTEGPYYVAGEFVRKDIVEDQEGVPLTLDFQILDVETCEPIPEAYLEIWHCNSTGVYSGVAVNGNGNGDESNWDATFLRGLQVTDDDGAVSFDTLFPGHYVGRTTHIHVMVHTDAQAHPNGTVHSTTASHVGQVYFDQSLITTMERHSAYVPNTQPLTTNEQDFLLRQAAQTSDPFVNYVYMGDEWTDGVLGWISFGVNRTLARQINPGAILYEEGGEAGPGGGFPGGPPPGFPTGGFPFPTQTRAP